MKKIRDIVKGPLPFLLGTLLVFGAGLTPAFAGMGLDFGDGGATLTDESCAPEENPVIVPGPLGSPLRICAADAGNFLIADYTKGSIYKVDSSSPETPVQLFKTKGKPLSVIKLQKRRGAIYLVGNDQDKTIEKYTERKGEIKLRKRMFRKSPVQALDMAVDERSGKIYVVDGLTGQIKVIKVGGRLVKSFGGFGQLVSPKGIALDLENNEVVVSDYGDSRVGISASIQIFDLAGNHLKTITGAFSRPQGLTVLADRIYVADAILGQVLAFDRATGSKLDSYGCFGSGDGHLLMPMDVALSEVTQDLYIADNRNGRITVLPLNQ